MPRDKKESPMTPIQENVQSALTYCTSAFCIALGKFGEALSQFDKIGTSLAIWLGVLIALQRLVYDWKRRRKK